MISQPSTIAVQPESPKHGSEHAGRVVVVVVVATDVGVLFMIVVVLIAPLPTSTS